jgi:hypothetical protein
MKIDEDRAAAIMREEAAHADTVDAAWLQKMERLSELCANTGKTHIAFLGTAMLAKAVDHRADLLAIKPKHAAGNANAFSARTLAENVLVPLSAELGISLGVTSRQPLNNQPYFRMTRLDDGTPVKEGEGRRGFEFMLNVVRELQSLRTEAPARAALRAFIAVRRRYQPRYADAASGVTITPDQLVDSIRRLVLDNSEGGRRAQAVVAGLMDVFAGPQRVESGRINDPSRKYPGDVCVRSQPAPETWEKAIEVRDKPVSFADVQIFGKKCVDMTVREAALVMVHEQQERLDEAALTRWANGFGIGLTLFYGWNDFVDQALFWSGEPKPIAASRAVGFIHQRLVAVEASPAAVSLWHSLTQRPAT